MDDFYVIEPFMLEEGGTFYGITVDQLQELGFTWNEDGWWEYQGEWTDTNNNTIPDFLDELLNPDIHENPSWENTGG